MVSDHPAPILSPTLTIGIPAFNAGKTLRAAIESVLRQTWRGTMEILVVDDGSTDDTVRVATQLAGRYGAVRVVRHDRNRGRPAARNTILREGRGQFLTWMDADDEWYPHKLAVQFDRLLSHERATDPQHPLICMCAYDWKWSHTKKLSHRAPEIDGDQLKGLLNGRIGAYLWTMLGTMEAFRNVGDFDEQLPRLQDLDFTIRFVARGGRLIMSDPRMPLCLYHKNDDEKPGRVIANSMAHIRRKHAPLFGQYGSRFRRAARRQHLLLAARHGYKNEGRMLGAWYQLQATLATPGRLLQLLRLRRPPAMRKSPALETIRASFPDAKLIARNRGGSGRVDIVMSLSGVPDEPLRAHFRSLGHSERMAGIWYLPTPNKSSHRQARDHAGLIDAGSDSAWVRIEAAALGRMAVSSNSDGVTSILYLGTPIRTDEEDVASMAGAFEKVAGRLVTAVSALRQAGPEIHLHLVVPDSETLLWRRYAAALQEGQNVDFEAWLLTLPTTFAACVDHRDLAPLLVIEGVARTHVHVLTESSTLEDLRASMARHVGTGEWPPAPHTPLGLPTRHGGLPYFERLLHRYRDVLGPAAASAARQRYWSLPAEPGAESPPAAALTWLRKHGRWSPLSKRFSPAESVIIGSARRAADAPEDFQFPIESEGAVKRSISEFGLLRALADLR